MLVRRFSLVVALVMASACSSSPAPVTASAPATYRAGLITRAELDSEHGRRLGDAIRILRPGMLLTHGEPMQFWIDGNLYDAGYFERLPADVVLDVTKITEVEARQLFGNRSTKGPALVIRTRR